jgi:hypothetical protein
MLAVFLLAVAVVQGGQSFTCTPIRVWDGDGPIWCREGPRIRLAGIAAREIDGSCRTGHPCPRASGIVARDTLVRLLGGAKGRSATGHILVTGPRPNADRLAMQKGIAPVPGAPRQRSAISAAP